MGQRSKTEVTTRFATTVDDLPSAWAFVMEHVDKVGPQPRIEISPVWSYRIADMEEDHGQLFFEVSVGGMVEVVAEGASE